MIKKYFMYFFLVKTDSHYFVFYNYYFSLQFLTIYIIGNLTTPPSLTSLYATLIFIAGFFC